MEELNIETMEEGGAYDKRRRYRQGKRGRAVGVAGIVEKAEDEPEHHYVDEFGEDDAGTDDRKDQGLAQATREPEPAGDSKGNRETDALEEEMAEEGGVYDPRRYRRRRARRDDGPMLESEEAELTELEFVHETVVGGEAAGDDDTEEYRPTRGEHFGHRREALSEAGKKGAEISTKMRTEEQRKEAARKAARTRAERYGHELHVSDPSQDELQGIPTKVYRDE